LSKITTGEDAVQDDNDCQNYASFVMYFKFITGNFFFI